MELWHATATIEPQPAVTAHNPQASSAELAVIHRQHRSDALIAVAVIFLATALLSTRYPHDLPAEPVGDGYRMAEIQSRLDPNSAAWFELAQLPNIGPSVANRIVRYREEFGASSDAGGPVFRRPADITKVRGVGDRTRQRIAPYLRFDDKGSRNPND